MVCPHVAMAKFHMFMLLKGWTGLTDFKVKLKEWNTGRFVTIRIFRTSAITIVKQ